MAKKKTEKEEPISAKSVAEAMAANMQANMADPNFEADKDRMQDEAAKNALRKHAKKLEDAGITIPGSEKKKNNR